MPRVRRRGLPPALFQHLLDRIAERQIAAGQIELMAIWLDAEPEVPEGAWYKRFPGMLVCGEGELVLVARPDPRSEPCRGWGLARATLSDEPDASGRGVRVFGHHSRVLAFSNPAITKIQSNLRVGGPKRLNRHRRCNLGRYEQGNYPAYCTGTNPVAPVGRARSIGDPDASPHCSGLRQRYPAASDCGNVGSHDSDGQKMAPSIHDRWSWRPCRPPPQRRSPPRQNGRCPQNRGGVDEGGRRR